MNLVKQHNPMTWARNRGSRGAAWRQRFATSARMACLAALGTLSLASLAGADINANLGKRYSADQNLRPGVLDMVPTRIYTWTPFDDVYYFQIHNTMDHGDSITGWLDTGYRTFEIDVIDRGDWENESKGPYVTHGTSPEDNACAESNARLGNCFDQITDWLDRNNPIAPIVVFVDMKASYNPAAAWYSDEVADLDRWISNYLGSRMYRYSDLKGHLGATTNTMRTELEKRGFPTIGTMYGKIVVALTGGRFGQVNQGMNSALHTHLNGNPATFFCPDVDAGDEGEISGAIDGITTTNSQAFVCSNLEMGDHADDVLARSAAKNQMIHTWGKSGDYDNLSYGYNHMATSLGAQFIGWDYKGDNYHDPWFSSDGILPFVGRRADLPAFFQISYHGSNRCLDVNANSYKNGSKITFWPCLSGKNQMWYITAEGQIRPRGNNKYCLDIKGGTPKQNATVHLWDCDGGDSEKWYLRSDGKIASLHDRSFCLRANTNQNNSATLSSCNNNNSTMIMDRIKLQYWLSNDK